VSRTLARNGVTNTGDVPMGDIKSEEYKFLRQEHENNRKFIFERPLLIIGVTFASAITISDKNLLVLLPIPFLALLYLNDAKNLHVINSLDGIKGL
jgi:hypothetical protein